MTPSPPSTMEMDKEAEAELPEVEWVEEEVEQERTRRQKLLRESSVKFGDDCPKALRWNYNVLRASEVELAKVLLKHGQGHLFEGWASEGTDDDAKHAFFAQIEALEKSYDGGIEGYLTNAKKLLAESKDGVNPLEGYTPSVPAGEKVEYGSGKHLVYEERGVKEACYSAFVLVAGGLGERLGASGIKIGLAVELATGTPYIQLYIESILALQKRGEAVNDDGEKRKIPLAIMTSDDTHNLTQKLLEDNDYFGMEADQVTLLKQAKVPCLIDTDARLALEKGENYKLQTKPHGHGDVHALLYDSGLLQDWEAAGVKRLVFFQDTNALVFRVIPAAIGVSIEKGFHVNSLAVPRKAKEAIGGIALLKHENGSQMTVNVEYNQLEPLLKATGNRKGDVNDRSGFSPYPGNINQLIITLPEYIQTLERTGGKVVEFVNPKYTDDTKTAFKSSTRLECMMQDYPKLLEAGSAVGFTVFENWVGYSPVKNSPKDAREKAASGNPSHSATTGEFDFYFAGAEMLRLAGANMVPKGGRKLEFNGIKVTDGPRVVLKPSFAASMNEVKAKVKSGDIKMTAQSVLILEGEGITLGSLDLDGALHIKCDPGAKVNVSGLKVRNKGWSYEPVADGYYFYVPEPEALRGFKIVKHETKEVHATEGEELELTF